MACRGCGKKRYAAGSYGVTSATGRWWLSTRFFTVQVEVDTAGRVSAAAPLVKKFTGQPFTHLLMWIQKLDRPQFYAEHYS